MPTIQTKNAARGIKRKCQGAECGRPFYDLNRSDFSCPICGLVFDLQAALLAQQALEPRQPARKSARPFTSNRPFGQVPATIDSVQVSVAANDSDEIADGEDGETAVTGSGVDEDDTILAEDLDAADDILVVDPEAKEQQAE